MASAQPYRVKTITEYHRVTGLPKPEHPLVSVINIADVKPEATNEPISVVFDFYCISLKRDMTTKVKYGQQNCDFDEGVLFCTSPGQVLGLEFDKEAKKTPSGWMILIHPDFLWNTTLAKTIKQYEYFSYSVNEALYLSDREETMLNGIAQYIAQEYHANTDKFSQNIIIAQLESLLSYAERFYHRQFITRKVTSYKLLDRLEEYFDAYFGSDSLAKQGAPTVQQIASALNISPNYLSGLLKSLTGQTTQQHISDKVIEKAKERLSTTNLSVSEIAYGLGFEHSQSFNKLFKIKTKLSPTEFRQSFN